MFYFSFWYETVQINEDINSLVRYEHRNTQNTNKNK